MTILAAVSGEHAQDRVVEVGHDMATAYGDDLRVVHVMKQDRFEEIRGRSEITRPVVVSSADEDAGLMYISSNRSVSEYNLEDASADAEGVAQECISNTLSDEQQENVSTQGRVGDPAAQIVQAAEQVDARFIVVGGRKRSPVGKAVFGSVSQSVILDSERPVVTINRKE